MTDWLQTRTQWYGCKVDDQVTGLSDFRSRLRRERCLPAEVALRLYIQLINADDRVVHLARAALAPAAKHWRQTASR